MLAGPLGRSTKAAGITGKPSMGENAAARVGPGFGHDRRHISRQSLTNREGRAFAGEAFAFAGEGFASAAATVIALINITLEGRHSFTASSLARTAGCLCLPLSRPGHPSRGLARRLGKGSLERCGDVARPLAVSPFPSHLKRT